MTGFTHRAGTASLWSPCHCGWQGMVYYLSSLWPQCILTFEDTEFLTFSNRDQMLTLGSNAAVSTSCSLLRMGHNWLILEKCKEKKKRNSGLYFNLAFGSFASVWPHVQCVYLIHFFILLLSKCILISCYLSLLLCAKQLVKRSIKYGPSPWGVKGLWKWFIKLLFLVCLEDLIYFYKNTFF